MIDTYNGNIEELTLGNTDYRKVIYTGEMQLVVMNLDPDEDIPAEEHPDIDQFIRVENGEALVRIEDSEYHLEEDEVIVIPSGNEHYVDNISDDEPLKIYTIYTPPEHPEGTIHSNQKEADEAEHHH